MANKTEHVCIIGGGIIGACCAYFLNKAGLKVTVIDKDKFGAACSAGNCGFVSPSMLCQSQFPESSAVH